MEIIDKLALSYLDPGIKPNLKGLNIGDTVVDFEILLSSKRSVSLSSMLQHGPVILVFIRGTWCPFCRMHMNKLYKWIKTQSKKSTLIVVSSESADVINEWLKENHISNLFASDPKLELAQYFGTHISSKNYSQAATFLIDQDQTIKLAYRGKRNQKHYDALDSKLT